MSDEARFSCSLQITKDNLEYRSYPTTFLADVAAGKGPAPGAFSVTVGGVDVTLSALATPALCLIRNLDDTNFVEYGIWDDPDFYPLGEVLAGESYILRLSRNIGVLRIKANTATCFVVVEAFSA